MFGIFALFGKRRRLYALERGRLLSYVFRVESYNFFVNIRSNVLNFSGFCDMMTSAYEMLHMLFFV